MASRKNPHDRATTTGKRLAYSRSYKKDGIKTIGSTRVNTVVTTRSDIPPPPGGVLHRKPKPKPKTSKRK